MFCCLVGRIEASPSCPEISSNGKTVPPVLRYVNQVSHFQVDLVRWTRLVRCYGKQGVVVLSAEVVYIVQGTKLSRGVDVARLHQLIGQPTYLQWICKMASMNMLDRLNEYAFELVDQLFSFNIPQQFPLLSPISLPILKLLNAPKEIPSASSKA